MQRVFAFLPGPRWVGEFVATKNSIIHIAFLSLIVIISWQAHGLEGLDSSSLLYTYVSGDEVGEGPLDPSAYAKVESPGIGGPRLAAVESSDGPFITFDAPEVNFAQTLNGSAVVAPTNPIADQVDPSDNVSSSEAVTKQSVDPVIYTIQEGDTIAGIAEQFNISASTILWANGLSGDDVIRIGDHLTILPVSGVLHTVKSGDTVLALASKYDIKADEIISYNQLSEDGALAIGDKLIIPGGSIAAPQPTPRIVPRSTHLASDNTAADDLPVPATSEEKNEGFVWPTATRHISQYFSGSGRGHTGIDIDNRAKPAIYAAEAGTVQFQGWLGGYGNLLILDHGNGITTYYAHLEKFYVGNGDRVSQGQAIAKMGSTGRSTGPHLHFEVRRNGVPINPLGLY